VRAGGNAWAARSAGPLGPDEAFTLAEEAEEEARADLSDARQVTRALLAWVRAAKLAGGAERVPLAQSAADRLWIFSRKVEEAHPEAFADDLARARARVELVRALILKGQERFREAAAIQRRAAEILPDGKIHVAAGQLHYRLEDWREVLVDATAAIEFDPTPRGAYALLARARWQLGDTGGALEAIAEARRRGAPCGPCGKLEKRFQAQHEVEQEFSWDGTTHFDVVFEDIPEDREQRRRLMRALEPAYQRVCGAFHTVPLSRVIVVVYPSRQSYEEALDAPRWSAAAYDGKMRIPQTTLEGASDERLNELVSHEFTHAMVRRLSRGRAPTWLNEGLAEYFETADGENHRYLRIAKKVIDRLGEKSGKFSLSRMSKGFESTESARVALAYMNGYLTVRHLVEQHQTFRVLRLLEALGREVPFEEALYQELHLRPEQLEPMWFEQAQAMLALP
jgi:tetratricopeptide (TPR) repeat protein